MTEPAAGGLAVLYASEASGLRSLAYLLTGSAAAADDIVQESFAAVAPRFDRLDPAAQSAVVAVDGGTLYVHGVGVSEAEFHRLIAGLRLADEQAWNAAIAAYRAEPSAACDGCSPPTSMAG